MRALERGLKEVRMPPAKQVPASKAAETKGESKADPKEQDNTFSYKNSKGTTYYLHSKPVQLKNGKERAIFFFAKDVRPDTALKQLPEGYEVSESTNSGLPVLKKQAS